jgi:hypothetical protein
MTQPPSENQSAPPQVFDRAAVRAHRDRAARGFGNHAFLVDEIAARLADRLHDINRSFAHVFDLGCHTGQLARAIGDRPEAELWVQSDLSERMVARASGLRVAADEEALPFGDGVFDLVISALSLHWVNDLPGTLAQINRCLKPDGLFLAAVLGGSTLHELRVAFMDGELETEGSAGPRVSPFAEVRDAGGLLQRAGFALPVADTEPVSVTYPDLFALMTELRGMGEANAVAARRRTATRRATLTAAAAAYQDRFGDAEGRLPATFDVLYLTGWRPHPSQTQPLKPGSGGTRLEDAIKKGRPG